MQQRDELFKKEKSGKEPFAFDQKTVAVIDDMMARSIPCYWDMQDLTAQLAIQHYQPGTRLYDLGCSTGNTIKTMHALSGQKMDLVGVDSSQDMINLAQKRTQGISVEWKCQPVETMDYPNASVILASYVLQFIQHDQRLGILKRMVTGLRNNGLAIICDKLKSPHAGLESMIRDYYFKFKEKNGYSRIEIERKETALQQSLFPMTLQQYEQLFQEAGFSQVDVIFKYYQFTIMLARK